MFLKNHAIIKGFAGIKAISLVDMMKICGANLPFCVYAFQIWPGLVLAPAMALRVSTMHEVQSASS